MTISIVAAVSLNNVIGKGGGLPWHLPADLKHFAKLTNKHSVIMGRKTYESLIKKLGHPLYGRKNIVLTRQGDFRATGAFVANSFEKALRLTDTKEVFIIGGAEIYKIALPLADKMYLTLIKKNCEGDVLFPKYDPREWNLVCSEEHLKDVQNECDFAFLLYERKKP